MNNLVIDVTMSRSRMLGKYIRRCPWLETVSTHVVTGHQRVKPGSRINGSARYYLLSSPFERLARRLAATDASVCRS